MGRRAEGTRRLRLSLVAILTGLALGVAGLGGGEATGWDVAAPAPSSPGSEAACPVTRPNGEAPPGERPSAGHHGNGALWVVLWPDGRVLVPPENVRRDGSLEMKFPWWRGVPGQLAIAGRRLDGEAPPLRAETGGGRRLDRPATPGAGARYGAGRAGFRATALVFPAAGCWEVTGKVGDAALTFVALVVPVERWPWAPTVVGSPSP